MTINDKSQQYMINLLFNFAVYYLEQEIISLHNNRTMKLLKLSSLAFTAALLLCLSHQATAQEVAPDETAIEADDKKSKKKKKKKDKAEKSVAYMSLSDLLRREPGVLVQGSGNSTKVSIRGGAGASGTDPLYVIDRVPIGNSYSQAAGMVDVNDIANINVLKGADAQQYGTRGNSGVIEIYTKKN